MRQSRHVDPSPDICSSMLRALCIQDEGEVVQDIACAGRVRKGPAKLSYHSQIFGAWWRFEKRCRKEDNNIEVRLMSVSDNPGWRE